MKLLKYIKDLIVISTPIIIGNLGFIFIGVGDVVIAGRHSTQTLASISIATAILNCIIIVGVGILSAVSPIVSNLRGEGENPQKYFFPTVKFAFVISVILSLIILGIIPLFDFLGYSSEITHQIKLYSFITAFSTFGTLLHSSTKDFLQSFEIVIFPNIVTIMAVFLNVALNVLFVFGYGRIPELGVAGLALASLITRYVMGLVLFVYSLYKLDIPKYTCSKYYKTILKIGTPIAVAILIEFVAFNIITVVVGRISEMYAAAQNIVCTLTSISFMVPLAISNGLSVKVGYSNGAKNYIDVKKYILSGILMSEVFMFCSILVLLFFPEFIISLFTKDLDLIKVTIPVIYVLVLFQLFDGLQVTLAGIFKGLKDTKVVLFSNLISFWCVSIPLGTILAFKFQMDLLGYWYAIFVASIILNLIMLIKLCLKWKKWDSSVLS